MSDQKAILFNGNLIHQCKEIYFKEIYIFEDIPLNDDISENENINTEPRKISHESKCIIIPFWKCG